MRAVTFLRAFVLALAFTTVATQVVAAAAWTDQADYSPGSTVTLSGDNSNGAGYLAGETVDVAVSGPNGYASSCSATADDAGAWSCQVTLWDTELAAGNYSYTATGALSGVTEYGTFTDNAGVSITNAAFAWHRTGEVAGGFNVTVSGKYTCNNLGSAANNCTTNNGITLTVPGVTGSKFVNVFSTAATNVDWGPTVLQFRTSGGDFTIPADGKYTIHAVLDTNFTTDPTADATNYFGVDNLAPVTSITCNNASCSNPYVSDVTVNLSDTDPGTAATASGVPSNGNNIVYCVDSTDTCVPGTAYNNSGFNVARVNNATFYVRYHSTDNVGNVEATKSQAITFTNDAAPGVSSTSPANNDTGVALDASIVLTFTEDVHTQGAWFLISCANSGTHTATPSGNNTSPITLNPDADFTGGELCTVTVYASLVTDTDSADPPDNMAANYQFSFTTLSPNQPPVADAGEDYTGSEGTAIDLDGTGSSDPDGDTLTYKWTVDNTGIDGGGSCSFDDDTSATPKLTCNDNGTAVVTLTVDDGNGATDDDDANVTVSNVAPVLSALTLDGNTGTACIGDNNVTLDFSWTDDGSNDTFTGTIDWGDASSDDNFTTSPVSTSHNFAAGLYTITVTANDDDLGSDSDTGSVSLLYDTGTGILQPINNTRLGQAESIFKYGSTLPVKVKVTDCDGVAVSTLSLHVSVKKITTSTPDGVSETIDASGNANTGDLMRFTGYPDYQYIFNLSTKVWCPDNTAEYRITVSGAGIADVTASIGLKK